MVHALVDFAGCMVNEALFRMLEEAVAEYQKKLESYNDRRRRYRDIVEHLQLGASLIKR